MSGCGDLDSTDAQTVGVSPRLELDLERVQPQVSGTWVAHFETLEEGGATGTLAVILLTGFWDAPWIGSRLAQDLGDMESPHHHSRTVAFELRSEAGVVRFSGRSGRGTAEGEFEFSPTPQVVPIAALELSSTPGLRDQLIVALPDLRKTEISSYRRAGLVGGFPDAARLKGCGDSPEFAAAAIKCGATSVDDPVSLRKWEVHRELLESFQHAGYRLSAPEIVRFETDRVSADFVRNWSETGCRLKVEDLFRLSEAGISPGFGKVVHAAFPEAGVEDFITMKN